MVSIIDRHQVSHSGPLLFILYFVNVTRDLQKVKYSLFPGELNTFHEINNLFDALDLQSSIDAFTAWCKENFMRVNVDECKIMSFYRIKIPIIFIYSTVVIELTKVVEMSALGVLMDTQRTSIIK